MGLDFSRDSSVINTSDIYSSSTTSFLYESTFAFSCPNCFLLDHHPYSDLLNASSCYFSASPSSTSRELSSCIYFFFSLAYSGFKGLGLFMNELIKSIGRANSPTPPKSASRNHPTNDMQRNMYIVTYILWDCPF